VRQTEPDADPYAQIVEYYDLEHDAFQEDVSLISHLVDTVGDPVLELACGTGRVMAPLARAGRQLTGVDSSAAMLAAARTRLSSSAGDVALVNAEMTNLPLPNSEFGVVILALNGLLHATTTTEQRTALEEANRCLDPRGMLYIDVANPGTSWPDPGHQPAMLESSWTSGKRERVQKFQSVTVDAGTQIVQTSIWYDVSDESGAITRWSSQFDLRYVYAAELELMLELSGFVEWQLYGSYELDPYTSESSRIIALAEKTASR
jgi:ubiquinone/menaquinone biosynthesis C-methylase UbiE